MVDEACFVNAELYNELVPMIQTDGGHLILISSHRSEEKMRSYVDIRKLRCSTIIVNDVVHVCNEHVVAMIDPSVTANNCLCYLFQQPHHLMNDAAFRTIAHKFSGLSCKRTPLDKSQMLSELGILPPLDTVESLPGTIKNLVSGEAHGLFLNTVFTGAITPHVTVYIDPAPTDVGSSVHALALVGSLADTGGFVLLAAEEFSTMDADPASIDPIRAIAGVFIRTLKICTILHAEISTVFLALEANSGFVGGFWEKCKELAETVEVLERVTIYAAASTHKRKRGDYGAPGLTIGYRLGPDKVARVLHFYTKLMNPGKLTCSDKLWSTHIRVPSIPLHVLENLERMQIKAVSRSGNRTFKASGKGGVRGDHVTDDLAVAVIMSTVLQEDIERLDEPPCPVIPLD